MKIQTLKVGYLQTNSYIVTCDTQKEAAVIDPGGDYEKIRAYLERNGKTAEAVLLTHGHFDHILAAKKLQDDGAKVYINTLDKDFLANPKSISFGFRTQPFSADVLFNDGDIITVGTLQFKVLHTPGHTKGSSCFIIGDTIFTGDTMFYQDYGRTDFPGGSQADMENSLRKLLNLHGDYNILPGHMRESTLEHERKYNPIVL